MDSLVLPLQDKLEEWKRSVLNLDKEYTKGNYCQNSFICQKLC